MISWNDDGGVPDRFADGQPVKKWQKFVLGRRFYPTVIVVAVAAYLLTAWLSS